MSDLIDRQEAIDSLHMHLMYRMGTDSNKKRLDEWINNLPSAQPTIEERKTGTWIRLTNDLAQCSECKDYIDNAIRCGYNYCPNCGADMSA